jgi:hypothetical protein
MSIGSSGNWPPSGAYVPTNHSQSMINLPTAPGTGQSGQFYPPQDDMFPGLPPNTSEREEHSPPSLSPMSKPEVKHPGGGLNYIW